MFACLTLENSICILLRELEKLVYQVIIYDWVLPKNFLRIIVLNLFLMLHQTLTFC